MLEMTYMGIYEGILDLHVLRVLLTTCDACVPICILLTVYIDKLKSEIGIGSKSF